MHAKPRCLFCEKDNWGEACEVVNTIAQPRPQGHLCRRSEELDDPGKGCKNSKILGDFQACAVSE